MILGPGSSHPVKFEHYLTPFNVNQHSSRTFWIVEQIEDVGGDLEIRAEVRSG